MDHPLIGKPLGLGERLALGFVPTNRNPRFALGSLGGRYLLICAVGDQNGERTPAALALFESLPGDEEDKVCALLWPGDATDPRLASIQAEKLVLFPGGEECQPNLGLVDSERHPDGRWVLLDPSMRIAASWKLADGAHAARAWVALPSPNDHAGVPLHAPVLVVPRVFEPNFCTALMDYYERRGGVASGVTRSTPGGGTYVTQDDNFKRREDCLIEDEGLRTQAMQRIFWRLLPEVEKAFMWRATRMERYLVARYDSASGGFFRPHRDNTTKGTAHRRFAVTLNLNTRDYEGGELRFPEFGRRTYRAPAGGAIVFSCALLHEATPVTRGRRYAFLPFLYDERAAETRAANNHHLADDLPKYTP